MAGAIATAARVVTKPRGIIGTFPIKNSEIVNAGDLVNLDTNGQVVVASKTQGAVVKALGIAFFEDENGTATYRTGVAGLTVKCGIAKKAHISNLTGTLVPSINNGLPVFLGAVPTATVTNYTCARSTTANDKIQQVGFATSATEIEIDVVPESEFIYQSATTSTTIYG